MSAFSGPLDRVLITGDAVLTLNFNSLRDLLRFKQRVSGPPWISTWNWPAAKQSVAALARLEPQVLAPGHGTPMANATAAKLRALAQSLNARPDQRKQLPGIRVRAEGRRAHGSVNRLADAENPLVQQTAARLSQGCRASREQVERFVSFVRDDLRPQTGRPRRRRCSWGSDSATQRAPCSSPCATRPESRPACTTRRSAGASSEVSIRARGTCCYPGTCRTPGWKQTLTGDGGGSMPTSTTTPSARRLHASSSGTAGRRDTPWPAPIAAGKPSTLTPGSSSRWKPWKAMTASGPSQPIITRALTTGTGPDRSGPCSTVTPSQA